MVETATTVHDFQPCSKNYTQYLLLIIEFQKQENNYT